VAVDEPVQSYYPTARIRLIVRFEDFGNPKIAQPPKLPPQLRRGKGKTKDTNSLTVVQQNGIFELVGAGDDPNHLGTPQQQISSSDGLTHAIDGVIPSKATLRRNGIRTATTLSATLPFSGLPFDPRAIRAVGIQYFLGCVSADDFQRGIAGLVRSDATPSGGLPFHVVPDNFTDSAGRRRSNLRFEGWIDDWEDLFADADAPEVDLECTDNTRLLLEQDAPPRLHLDPALPIDQAIAVYLSNFPQFRGLSVGYLPLIDRSKIPRLKDALGKTAFQPQLGPPLSGGGAAGSQGATSKLKVWDYLTDVAGAVGHNIRMIGSTVTVQRPRTIYDARFPGRSDDPFTGRRLPSGAVLQRRLFIYGHNIAEMRIKRHYATYVPKNVEIRSYDPQHKRVIVVRYPTVGGTQKKGFPRQFHPKPGDTTEQQWWVITRPGIRDEATARQVAQSIYEQQGRNELVTRIITKNLGSFGGGNLDPDVLDLLPGDAVDVEVKSGTQGGGAASSVNDIQKQMQTRAADFLMNLGYSKVLATAYQTAIQSVGLPTTFRTKSVGIDWDMEAGGVSIDLETINYIEIRADQDLETDEQITPADVQGAGAAGTGPVDVVVNDDVGI